MQLEYVDVVFANRPDSNTPMEGKHPLTRLRGASGWDNACLFCNMRGWEILSRPLSAPDWWPLPLAKRRLVFEVECTCPPLTHEIHPRNLTTSPHLFSSIIFSRPLSLSFCFCLCGITRFHRVSKLHPALPVLQKQDYLGPPGGALVYFWAGLTRYKLRCELYSFNALALPFPHIYLMSPFISFYIVLVPSSITSPLWRRYLGPSSVLQYGSYLAERMESRWAH